MHVSVNRDAVSATCTAGPNAPDYCFFPWAWSWTLQKPPLLNPLFSVPEQIPGAKNLGQPFLALEIAGGENTDIRLSLTFLREKPEPDPTSLPPGHKYPGAPAKIVSPLFRDNFWLAIALAQIVSQNASQTASRPQEKASFLFQNYSRGEGNWRTFSEKFPASSKHTQTQWASQDDTDQTHPNLHPHTGSLFLVTFGSPILTLLSLSSSIFCRTPFAGLLLLDSFCGRVRKY